ncbi:MAG: hypothetical protein LUG26_07540 [Ruminococcus sp.]|nr:hypothetical protein [Ruminococcus sp.]
MSKKEKTALVMIQPEVLQEAISEYGDKAQVDMAIEEMSELIKALCKERRYEGDNTEHAIAHANVIEEMADTAIMLAQLIIIFDKDNEIQKEIDYKQNRLLKRLRVADKAVAADAAQAALRPAT